jgi:hypothetical protein
VLVSSTGITVVAAVTSGQQEISMAWLIKYTQVIPIPERTKSSPTGYRWGRCYRDSQGGE